MELLLYFAQASLYSLLLWGIYCLVWKGRPWHRASRAYLLVSAVLPLVLPLIHLQVSHAPAVAAYRMLPAQASVQADSGLSGIVQTVYTAVTIAVAVFYALAYAGLLRKLRRGVPVQLNGYRVLTWTGLGPGTIGRQIFFPGAAAAGAVLDHELAHIRAGHRYDAALLQLLHIFCWMSPGLWLTSRELKIVHEFEADARALRNTDAAAYASLLLSRAFGVGQAGIAHHFFHHPLKRRILMLHQSRRRIAAPALVLSLLLTAGLCGGVLMAQTVEKNAPAAKADDGTPQPKASPAPAANPVPEAGSVKYKAPWIGPDGRIIHVSVEELHRWGKGGGC